MLVLANIETVITVAILIISFLGWLVNLANEKAKPPQAGPAGPRPRPREQKMRNEIDIFLREVGAGRKNEDEVAVEVVPEDEIRRRQPLADSRASLSDARESNLGEIGRPVLSDLGSGVRDHLSEHQAERVEQLVRQDLAPRVEPAVALGLARSAGAAAERGEGRLRRQNIVELLHDPVGVRQAILVSEILSPPLARRRRRRS